jgi:hypothetical protein
MDRKGVTQGDKSMQIARTVRKLGFSVVFGVAGIMAGCGQGGGGQKVTSDPDTRKEMIDAKKNFMQEKMKANRAGRARGGPSGP